MLELAFIVLAVLIALFGLCAFLLMRTGKEDEPDDYEDEPDLKEEEAREAELKKEKQRQKRPPEEKPKEADKAEKPAKTEKADKAPAALKEQKKETPKEAPKPEKKAEPEKKAAPPVEKPKEAEKTDKAPAALNEQKKEAPKEAPKPEKKAEPEEKPKAKETAAAEAKSPVSVAAAAIAAAQSGDRPKIEQPPKVEEKPGGSSAEMGKTRRIDLPLHKASGSENGKTRVVTGDELKQLRKAAEMADAAPAPKAPEPPEDYDDEYDEYEQAGFNPVPIIAVAAIVLLALGIVAFALVRGKLPVGNKVGVVKEPKTVTATVSNVIEKTDFVGSIECDNPSVRYFAAGGKIKSVNVKEGDRVQKGQTLYVIDSSAIEERIDLLRQRLKNATKTEDKTVESTDQVKSTASGTVSALNFSEGDSVAEGDVIAQVSQVTDYRVTLSFDADEAGTISEDSAVDIIVNGDTVSGTVTSVSLSEGDDDEVPIYTVTASFKKPGASGNAGGSINGVKSIGTSPISVGNRSTTSIRAKSGGVIKSLSVEEGDSVSEGAVIAVVSSKRTVSETSTDELQAKDINIQIEQLENELQNYTLKADVSGYVQKLYLKADENAAVNMQAAVIIPDGSLYMNVRLDQEFAGIEVPAAATFKLSKTTDSDVPESVWEKVNLETEYSGILSSILQDEAEPDKYTGHVTFEDQSGLMAGMAAKVSVVTYSKYDALLLPEKFVSGDSVFVWRSNRAEPVKVKTGHVTDDGYVEILEGLTTVDKVITGEVSE